MQPLLTWRNPAGNEENWFIQVPQESGTTWLDTRRICLAECALCLVAVTSAVETVAYGIFTLFSLLITPCNPEPFRFFEKLLESSSFTIIWTLADLMFYNPLLVNVFTHESLARFWVGKLFIPAFYREDDRFYVVDWINRVAPNNNLVDNELLVPLLREGRDTQELIDEGAAFLKRCVLQGLDKEEIKSFKECEAATFSFFLSRSVYMYAFGQEKNTEEIPKFFKEDTRSKIQKLRAKEVEPSTIKNLYGLVNSLQEFDKDWKVCCSNDDSTRKQLKALFDELRGVACGELSGLFVTKCFQTACENEGLS
ncbi:MAG: hypothetical protein AAGF04_02510 [Chlamydiota bacterium]